MYRLPSLVLSAAALALSSAASAQNASDDVFQGLDLDLSYDALVEQSCGASASSCAAVLATAPPNNPGLVQYGLDIAAQNPNISTEELGQLRSDVAASNAGTDIGAGGDETADAPAADDPRTPQDIARDRAVEIADANVSEDRDDADEEEDASPS
ncbi:hypothetical protein [Pontivivens ytuae]|uniref:Uncharacterized protein n=1 Tax=Pontivivens ytuae TaxID=2789856 RepID=A0A7S9LVC2_9RHOB|nr:hypothetical protein [Pontivivens ytuae]QPH55962.1 hypothetical protein I0K15_09635 [Pontivivens ytuae]